MCKGFFETIGTDALPILSEVMSEAGAEAGKIALKELQGEGMNIVGELVHARGLEIIALSDEMIRFRNLQCPYNLKGTNRELCEAMMSYDRMLVSEMLSFRVDMKIPKSIAAGDEWCEVIYSIKKT